MNAIGQTNQITYLGCPSTMLTGGWRRGIGLACLLFAAAMTLPAQDEQSSPNAVTLKTLVNFDGTNGGDPFSTLVQGTDGNLYGTTQTGGANGSGNIFKMTPSGSLTVLYSFCAQPNCGDGSGANGMVLGTDGNLYGTTESGGKKAPSHSLGAGTVFKITPTGALTTLYEFCSQPNCTDGADPYGFVLGSDGNFYGTTNEGGVVTPFPEGTVFKITPEGALTTLYRFCAQTGCPDGSLPEDPLIQAADGNFYGNTETGGAYNNGTVFKITPGGNMTTLYSFCAQPNCPDGTLPQAPLIQAASGNFYGTTVDGGNASGDGTVFRMTPAGALTTIYSFCAQPNCADGALPRNGGLVQAVDGNLYGTTFGGGTNPSCLGGLGCGTVFKVTPGGTLSTLHSFNGTDGEAIFNGLVQSTSGIFYGMSGEGGTYGLGTIFALSVGLPPFVETVPTSGEAGGTIQILGYDLTAATSVSFNGTPAAFTVESKTLISTTVPAGATTGFVTVTGPGGTLKSNVKFRVRP